MAAPTTSTIDALFRSLNETAHLQGVSQRGSQASLPGISEPRLFMALDLLAFWSSAFFALAFRFPAKRVLANAAQQHALAANLGFLLVYSCLIILFAYVHKLYSPSQVQGRSAEIVAVLKATTLATLLLTCSIYLAGVGIISRTVIAGTLCATLITMQGWRLMRRSWVERAPADGVNCHNVLIVGTDTVAQYLRHYLELHRDLGYRVVGLLAPFGVQPGPEALDSVDQMATIARTNFVDHIIVCARDATTISLALETAREAGLGIRVVPDLYGGLAFGAQVEYLGPLPTFSLRHKHVPTISLFLKRSIDIVVAALGLLVLLPVIAAIAIIIKRDSAGPVVYTSRRVGRKGNTFGCHKFRTMVSDAEALKASLQHLNERDGVLFKIANDPRVTAAGRVLRKYSLDEIPQLWNVLKGEMSLVGPRPPLASEVQQYELEHLRRLDVTPGITGLWQVEARNDPSFESYISLDLRYVEEWNLLTDIKLLFRTALVVFAGTGR